MLTQSPSRVPSTQSRTWSIAADAAEAADEAPRALMIAAPRCCTVGMNCSRYQLVSTTESAGLPSTGAWCRSGYCHQDGLPQIVTPLRRRTSRRERRPPLDGGVVHIRILRRGVIPPDRHALDAHHVHPRLLAKLRQRAVVIE